MPNNCYNEVKASKKILEELYDKETKKITFNKLIPMPKEIENSVADGSTKVKKAMYLYMNGDSDLLVEICKNNRNNQREKERIQEMIDKLFERYSKEEVIRSYKCTQKYGTDNWYDWSVKNWGTKWDAYQCEGTPKDGVLKFFTAWNPPKNIIEELCKKFPNSDLDWYYEEPNMDFAGHCYSNESGEIVNVSCPVPQNDCEDDMEM